MVPLKGRCKTRRRRIFDILGDCHLGSYCIDAHGDADLRQLQRFTDEEQRAFMAQVYYKTELCWHHQNGGCHRGVDCFFARGNQELRPLRRWCHNCGRHSGVAGLQCLDLLCRPLSTVRDAPVVTDELMPDESSGLGSRSHRRMLEHHVAELSLDHLPCKRQRL